MSDKSFSDGFFEGAVTGLAASNAGQAIQNAQNIRDLAARSLSDQEKIHQLQIELNRAQIEARSNKEVVDILKRRNDELEKELREQRDAEVARVTSMFNAPPSAEVHKVNALNDEIRRLQAENSRLENTVRDKDEGLFDQQKFVVSAEDLVVKKAVKELLVDEKLPHSVRQCLTEKIENTRTHYLGVFERFGNRYEGEAVNGKRHGYGRFLSKTKDIYEGPFENDQANGHGKLTKSNGSIYEGEFVESFMTGFGVTRWPSGARHEGHYVKGKEHGPGIYVYAEGGRFEGNFEDGHFSGNGILKSSDGAIYEGEFKRDQRSGNGVMKWPDGMTYRGAFEHDKPSGNGVMTSPEGTVYEGGFLNGLRSGQGKLDASADPGRNFNSREGLWDKGKLKTGAIAYKNGDWIKGDVQWLEDKQDYQPLNGEARITSETGAVFQGFYDAGKQHGQGRLDASADRDSRFAMIEGVWANGKLVTGAISFKNGDWIKGAVQWNEEQRDYLPWNCEARLTSGTGTIYEGTYEDGNRQGRGKLDTSADSQSPFTTLTGTWAGGKLTSGSIEFKNGDCIKGDIACDEGGNCRLITGEERATLPNGIRHEGSLNAGKPVGKNIYIFPDGQRFEGEWKEWDPKKQPGAIFGRGVLTTAKGESKKAEMCDGEIKELGLWGSLFG